MRVHEKHAVPTSYDVLKSSVEARIRSSLSQVQPAVLRNAMEHGACGGKMVRPMVVLLSCTAVGGRVAAGLDAATAIELLHNSSLLHDDIMDESSLRRGLPTTHVEFGIPMAILAGDTLVALAFQLMQSLHSPNKERITRIFADSFRTVCEGQGYDLSLTCCECAEQSAHMKMVEKKTAKLLEAASTIGALLGTVNETHIDALRSYGYQLGMAFQAQDDLLDAVGNERAMGKPTKLDAKNHRQTFLTLAYPQSDHDETHSGIVTARNAVAEYTHNAKHSLAVLPSTEAKEMLLMLAESLTERVA